MKNLIPYFIQQQYHKGRFRGTYNAASCFVDISGFVELTATLMQHEKDGAEVLTSVLNSIFNPIVRYVYEHGGMISTFAGDAFTALFPIRRKDAHLHAVQVAFFVNSFFEENKIVKTKYGDFEMGAKVGLSYGQVDWGILGKDDKYTFFFRGEAVDACAESEHLAEKGDAIADQRIMNLIHDHVEAEVLGSHFKLQSFSSSLPARKLRPAKLDQEVLNYFVLDDVIDLTEMAEFRNVCSIFLSFDERGDYSTLNEFVSKTLQLASEYRAYFNKVDFGDKGGVILILMGAPVAHERNVERALDFILALQSVPTSVVWRAGITHGLVYAGIMGGEERCEYTAIGDIVNQSARFVMQASWGDVWISEQIQHITLESYQTAFLGRFEFKGKAEPIPVYKLLSAQREIARKLYTNKMVGRQAELEKLHEFSGPVFDGSFAGVICVYGEAGIGKSRLTHEFREQLGDRVTWLHCSADEILRKAFNPFHYLLTRYFEQSSQKSDDENRARFNRILNRLIEKLSDPANVIAEETREELIRTRSVLGAQIGVFWEDSLWEQLDPKGKYENTLYAIKNLFKAESALKPVVIEIEDSHVLDADSLSLVKVLTRNVADYPMLVLSTSRYSDDGQKPRFDLEQEVAQLDIDLNYLADADLRAYAEVHVGAPISDSFHQLLRDKTQGNPFFAEQMLQFSMEGGYIEQREDGWHLTSALATQMPGTISAILIARIDRLSQDVKDVVKVASVIGKEFEVRLLSEVLQGSVAHQVEIAVQGQVWHEVDELQYLFKHALLRDAVYEMQLKARLRELHQLTAEAIEVFFADHLSAHYGDLAWHYEKAESSDKAVEYLEKAGDFAKDNYQSQQAIDYYDGLLLMIDGQLRVNRDDGDRRSLLTAQRVDTLLKKSEVLQIIGSWDECQNAEEEALRLAEGMTDKSRIAAAYLALGTLCRLQSDYGQAVSYLESSLEISRELGQKREIARVISSMGTVYIRMGDYTEALACYETSLRSCEELDDVRGIFEAVGNRGIIHLHRGDDEEAMVDLEKALEICRELNDKTNISVAICNMGIVHTQRNDNTAAMACFEECLTLAQELGNKLLVSTIIGNMGPVYRAEGDYTAAMKCAEEEWKICQEIGHKSGACHSIGNMGTIYIDRGDYDSAMGCLEECLEMAQQLGAKQLTSIAYGHLGNINREKGDYETAVDHYDRAITIARELEIKNYLCDYLIDKAEALYLTQGFSEARMLSSEGLHLAEEVGHKKQIFKGSVLVAKSDFALGHREKGVAVLSEMLAGAEDDSEIADLNYDLFELQSETTNEDLRIKAEEHGETALGLYLELYKKTPKFEYKKRIEKLGKKPI